MFIDVLLILTLNNQMKYYAKSVVTSFLTMSFTQQVHNPP